MPRKSGGSALTANSMINRDAKEANEERPGGKAHIGGYKKGGTVGQKHRSLGGSNNIKEPEKGKTDPIGDMIRIDDTPEPAPTPKAVPTPPPRPKSLDAAPVARRSGGKSKAHEDVAMDKALIKKMIKPSARTKKQTGGGVFTGPSYPGKVPGAVGGRTAKFGGGAMGGGMPGMQNYPGAMPSFNTPPAMGMGAPMGGGAPMGNAPMNPMGRKTGGRAKGKGKTAINIMIAAGQKPGGDNMMPPPGLGKPPGMMPVPVSAPGGMPGGLPPIGGAAPMPMPPGPPPGGMPMPRKAGGKVYRSYKDMDAGAGGARGRLEKTEIQAHK